MNAPGRPGGRTTRIALVQATRGPLAAAAFLAALAALALLPGASAHDLETDGEGSGHPSNGPSPLDVLPFIGPTLSPVADRPCANGEDAVGTVPQGAQKVHIGHIDFVESLNPGVVGQGLKTGSVDLWHLDEFENPNGIDGPSNPVRAPNLLDDHSDEALDSSIMMGPDGYLRGELWNVLKDLDGADLKITDVHPTPTYCIWGAVDHDGPYLFIDSTHDDPRDTATYQDLGVFYTPLFHAAYPGREVEMRYILFQSSTFDDPDLAVDFAWTHSDAPLDQTLSNVLFHDRTDVPPGAVVAARSWRLGDGSTATAPDPIHPYAK